MMKENVFDNYSPCELGNGIDIIASVLDEAILLVEKRCMRYVSPKAMEIMGITHPKEVLGKETRMFYFSDKDFKEFGKYQLQQIETEGFSSSIVTLKRLTDGEPLQISVHSQMLATNPEHLLLIFKKNNRILSHPPKAYHPSSVDFKKRTSEYKQILDSLHLAVLIMDLDGTVRYTNPNMDRIVASHPKGVGTKCYEICEHIWSEHPSDFCSWCKIADVIENGTPSQAIIKTKKGQHWLFSWAPLFDENKNVYRVVKTIADITEMMLEKSNMENLLLDIFITLPVGILMLDGRSNIIFINKTLEKRWGLPFREISMESLENLEVYQNDPVLSRALNDLREGKRTDEIEIEFIRHDDSIYMIRASFIPLKMDKYGWQGVLVEEDVTEILAQKKQVEQDLESKEKMLVEREKLAAVGQLAAGIGHELNTPTTYVRGNMQLFVRYAEVLTSLIGQIEVADSFDKRKEVLSKMETILFNIQEIANASFEGTSRIMSIIRSMRSFVQKQNDLNDTITIYAPIQDAMVLVANRVKNVGQILVNGVSFSSASATLLENESFLVKANASRIGQLFVVLLNNAVDAWQGIDSPDKEPLQLDIRIQRMKDTLNITVTDNCGGIPTEIVDRVFTPFFTTKSLKDGTGLGLSIARQIANEHGGSLTVENDGTRGSCFVFKIPVLKTPTIRPESGLN